jgi:hypothetical protein
MRSLSTGMQPSYPFANILRAATIASAVAGLAGCSSGNESPERPGASADALTSRGETEALQLEHRIEIDCPSTVPASIVPPKGNRLKLALHVASGTQDYACVGGVFTFQNPEAFLSDGRPRDEARHFFGAPGSPLFTSLRDGSEVDLTKLASVTIDATAVPWLLLQTAAVANAADGSPGLFTDVTFVQRMNTVRGVAPVGTCTAGQIVKVPYVANYYFYTTGDGKVCD